MRISDWSSDVCSSDLLQGFDIPGLTTRRATTTVELRDGQSFAIAGLIQSDFQDTVRQLPLLADVPVLGALLRSSEYQNQQTALVINRSERRRVGEECVRTCRLRVSPYN